VSSLIGNTTGLSSGPPTPGARSTTHAVSSDTEAGLGFTGEEALGFASALLAAYVRTGYEDLGELGGGSQTGSSVLRLVESFRLGPYLLPVQDEFLQNLTDRDLTTLSQRFAFPGEHRSATLEEIGQQLGVTREWVRQIEAKLLARLNSLRSRNSGVFDQLAQQVHLTERLITAAKVLTAGSTNRELLAKLLLSMEADWEVDGDYMVGRQVADQFASLKDRLVEHADENLLLTEEALAAVVGDLFTSESARDTFLTKFGLIQIFGFWGLRDNQQVRIAAALRTIGRPATKAEIGELAGLGGNWRGAALSNMETVVRADRTRWGFKDWVDDVYEGIVGEIEQRIDEHGGSVALSLLIEELKQFDVAESSIRTYAATDRFTVEGGIVSRSKTGYKPGLPHERQGAVSVDRVDGRPGIEWGQILELEERHFEGYSLKVSFDLAFHNGVGPEESLVVPVLGHPHHVASVIWRPHDVTRAVDIGRISDLLTELGFVAGDEIVVVPCQDYVRLLSQSEFAALAAGSDGAGPASGRSVTDDDRPTGGIHDIFKGAGN
jgi:hypothetical protein